MQRERPITCSTRARVRADRAELDQVFQGQLVFLELSDGERGAVQRQRRRDDVDAGAVEQARVADRRAFVDAAADLADDALADVHQLGIVAEADIGELHLAADFDEDPVGAIDHDVGDVVAGEQRLQRAIAQNVVADVLQQMFLLGDGHHHRLDRDDLVDDVADFLARRIRVELGQLRQIDGVDQGVKDGGLDLVIVFRAAVGHARAHRLGRLGRQLGAGLGAARGWRRGGEAVPARRAAARSRASRAAARAARTQAHCRCACRT